MYEFDKVRRKENLHVKKGQSEEIHGLSTKIGFITKSFYTDDSIRG